MPVMKNKNVVKTNPDSKPITISKSELMNIKKSKHRPITEPKNVSKGGVSNKVAPYNPSSTSQRTERRSSQNLVVSVIKNLLNKN